MNEALKLKCITGFKTFSGNGDTKTTKTTQVPSGRSRRIVRNSPRSRDVSEAANGTVCESTVDNFEVPFCTETLNTTH